MLESRNRSSFDAFHARYRQYVVRIILASWVRSDPAEEFEDLVQDVFLDAWRYYDRLQDASTCFGWLKLVARHAVSSRRRRFYQSLPTVSMEDPRYGDAFTNPDGDSERTLREVLPGPAVNYDDRLLTDELNELVAPEDQRLLGLYAAGYREGEIAALDRTPRTAIHRRMQRARNRIIGMLPAA